MENRDAVADHWENKKLEQVKEKAGEISVLLTEQSNDLIITTQVDLKNAAEIMDECRSEIKVIEVAFKSHKDNAYKTHKDLCAAETKQLSPFKSIIGILKPKILRYQTEQQEKERKQQQERERIQREEEAKLKKEAEEAKEKQVDALLEAGDEEKATEIMKAPTPVPVAAYVPEVKTEKVKGAGTKKVWKARCLNFELVHDKYKTFNQQAADKVASAFKKNAKEPGIEFYEDTQLTGK